MATRKLNCCIEKRTRKANVHALVLGLYTLTQKAQKADNGMVSSGEPEYCNIEWQCILADYCVNPTPPHAVRDRAFYAIQWMQVAS